MFSVSGDKRKLTINLPTSKSHYNRALILNYQLENKVEIQGVIESNDVLELKDALERLEQGERQFQFTDGGTTIRFFTALCGSIDDNFEIHVGDNFNKRPNQELFKILQELGCEVEYLNEREKFPIKLRGGFNKKTLTIDVSKSTQYYTAFKLLEYSSNLDIKFENANSSIAYINMTNELVSNFNKSDKYQVPVDPSSAAFALIYGAVINNVTIKNYKQCIEITHADNEIYNLFQNLNIEMKFEANDLLISPSSFTGLEIDISKCLDLFPGLVFLASFANSPSSFLNVENLKHKESNRLEEMMKILDSFEIEHDYYDTALKIIPKSNLILKEIIEIPEDHRVAMTYFLFLKQLGGGKLKNHECIGKSFKSFLSQFE